MDFKGKIATVSFGKNGYNTKVGGEKSLPFLDHNHHPKMALIISDNQLNNQKSLLNSSITKFSELVEKTKYYVTEFKIDALKIQFFNEKEVANLLTAILEEINVPLIIEGSGEKEKDLQIIQSVSEITEGEKILLYKAEIDNYKSIAAMALIYGHSIVAESPIDVNIAKQLNILLTDMGLPFERIIIDPMVASLGYGIEYTYSVMERIRLQALIGDTFLASPMICDISNAWNVREITVEEPNWNPLEQRGILWEAMSAVTLYSAGADLLVFKHPNSLKLFREIIGGTICD